MRRPLAVELCIAPLVARFLAEHPRLKLEIIAEDAFVDVVVRGFDGGVALRGIGRARQIAAPRRAAEDRGGDDACPRGGARPSHASDGPLAYTPESVS